jgi:hypothetical protein
MLTGRKLALTLAFTVLVALATGVSCKGFFVSPTLTSLTINPDAPNVEVGTTVGLQAFGVYSDGSSAYLTSGVSWSSSDLSVATVTGTGAATLTAVSTGTATISAGAQSVTSSATATVFILISAISITPTNPSMQATDLTGIQLTVYANNDLNNPADNLSSTATLTPYLNGTQVSTIACSYEAPYQVCTSDAAQLGTYQLIATYPGSTLTATATLTITSN